MERTAQPISISQTKKHTADSAETRDDEKGNGSKGWKMVTKAKKGRSSDERSTGSNNPAPVDEVLGTAMIIEEDEIKPMTTGDSTGNAQARKNK